MKDTERKKDYSIGFIYAAILCSLLLVFPFRIAGMEVLAVCLFVLCIVWMLVDIVQINQRKRKTRQQYLRLDFVVIMLLLYEIVLIAFSLMRKVGENEPEPDYSWNLMIIGLALLYFLVMEAGTFRVVYLDMILYAGLPVMAVLLLGYLFNPQIGERTRLWGDCTAAASYLLLLGSVGALQFCRCEERMKRIFYVMCTGIAFFLLACNHSVISFWIMMYTLLMIPILLRPTACLCLRVMQMLFFFVAIISGIGLLASNTELFLTAVNYDVEHIVCLDMAVAVGGLIFFYCWDRKPKGISQRNIVMCGFYKLDKLALRGMLMVFILFVSGSTAWKTLDGDKFGLRAVSGFAVPLIEEAGWNRSWIYMCMQEQGVVGAVLCIGVFLLLVERIEKSFDWDKPVKGILCVLAVSLMPQILLWEMTPNIMPTVVILLGSVIGYREKEERTE